ncbi:unnamed protein product [Discula destructiva]
MHQGSLPAAIRLGRPGAPPGHEESAQRRQFLWLLIKNKILASTSEDAPTSMLTERDQRLLAHAVCCTKRPLDVDYAALAERRGMTNVRSASNAWAALRKKITAPLSAAVPAATTAEDGRAAAAVATTKATKKREEKKKKNKKKKELVVVTARARSKAVARTRSAAVARNGGAGPDPAVTTSFSTGLSAQTKALSSKKVKRVGNVEGNAAEHCSIKPESESNPHAFGSSGYQGLDMGHAFATTRKDASNVTEDWVGVGSEPFDECWGTFDVIRIQGIDDLWLWLKLVNERLCSFP